MGPMQFTPDEHEKTVKTPIQVRGGQIQFYFDGPMPDLKNGIIGDLVLPYYAVLDQKARKLFSEERKIPLFKKKTSLFVQLRPDTADAEPFANHLLRPFLNGNRFCVHLDQETSKDGKAVVARIHDHSCVSRVFATIELQGPLYPTIAGAPKPRPSVRPLADTSSRQ